MANILDTIIADKREEVRQRQSRVSLAELREQAAGRDKCRNFYKAVTKRNPRGINVIAEVKKASPSAGLIRPDFDPVAIARTYERCGADAISVLTDEKYFQGRLEYLEQVKQAVSLPVLRKDFIIDLWQVYEARAAGADAILLIADALPPGELMDLMIAAAELTLTVLLEVHHADTLMAVRSLIGFPSKGYSVLGVNNRDLTTMTVDLNTTGRLAGLLENTNELVSESGVKTRDDVEKLKTMGVKAVLIGQTLCAHPDIEEKFAELFGCA
ncbi:MAG: indole-3-glycerol phosphate synthase TrpC [Sedimentisphaerales bacterium]|nr:indole-3-glycerol phosphate synthase TrpC [Sedimentisphaerales bacterium]